MKLLPLLLLVVACAHNEVELGDALDGGTADAQPTPDGPPAGSCDTPLPCPEPTTGTSQVSVCGRIADLETSDWIGVIGLQVSVHDPLTFVSDPAGSQPIATTTSDECGRYVFADVARPFNGFVAVTVDDVAPADAYVPTVVASPVESGQVLQLTAWATRHTTDEGWSFTAGLPAPTFGERGVHARIFTVAGVPQEGIVLTAGGESDPAGDYYFSDSDPRLRRTIDKDLTSTGANGTALIMDGTLISYSGEGGGCTWPSTLAATPPGAVFVTESGVPTCP